jgi:hypothetical protein
MMNDVYEKQLRTVIFHVYDHEVRKSKTVIFHVYDHDVELEVVIFRVYEGYHRHRYHPMLGWSEQLNTETIRDDCRHCQNIANIPFIVLVAGTNGVRGLAPTTCVRSFVAGAPSTTPRDLI